MAWQYPGEGEDVLVVHTLCVPPRFAGHRYGSRMVQYAKEYAAGHGCAVVRLDTYAHNEPAKRLCQRCGFRIAGWGRIAPRAHGRGAGVSGVQVAMSIGVVAVSIGE
ncbi:GNAT family N-acetyltransferase [Bifidobacterium adolescentis]|uniref:GNAT family N-acetyltransferase n=1 Tax=Bifidobacterium adolescentis TaxID=1680 RepID=UPI0034A5BF51